MHIQMKLCNRQKLLINSKHVLHFYHYLQSKYFISQVQSYTSYSKVIALIKSMFYKKSVVAVPMCC